MIDLSGRGTARAEDAQGTPTQSHISPSILVYEDENKGGGSFRGGMGAKKGNLGGELTVLVPPVGNRTRNRHIRSLVH